MNYANFMVTSSLYTGNVTRVLKYLSTPAKLDRIGVYDLNNSKYFINEFDSFERNK